MTHKVGQYNLHPRERGEANWDTYEEKSKESLQATKTCFTTSEILTVQYVETTM